MPFAFWAPAFFLVEFELGYVAQYLVYAPAVIAVLAFLGGRLTDKDALRSFGVGALASVGAVLLTGLLFFGACFLMLSGN
jgi:NADH:ubiquinone oxidoreductase subunit 6 (subunit J)